MSPTRSRRIRTVLLFGVAALAPVALGTAMHAEHEATLRTCEDLLAEARGLAHGLALDCTDGRACTDASTATTVDVQPQPVTPAPARLGDPGAFSFVVDLPAPHLVLATEIDERWIAGDPVLENDATYAPVATRPLAVDHLPPDLSARTGRQVRLFDASGERCTAVVGEPRLVAELTGDPGYLVEDEHDAGESFDAAQTWEHGRRLLVAPLRTSGECTGALWARDARFESPRVHAKVPGIDKAAAAIRGAYLRLPEVRKRKAEFDEYVASEPVVGKRPTFASRVTATAWADRGGAIFVFEAGGDEFGGCGGVASSWGMVVVDGDGAPVRADFLGEDTPLAVVDVDGDGDAEVLAEGWFGGRRLVTVGETGPSEVASLPEVPFYGCPC